MSSNQQPDHEPAPLYVQFCLRQHRACDRRCGSWVIRPDWANAAADPIKVGIATDLTGPIGYAGNADANVAKMVIKEINDAGGMLGRPLELFIEDTASNEWSRSATSAS